LINPQQRYNFFILSIASLVASWSPKAVSLKYPSPLGPNPEPGVPTTEALFSKRSKNSQLESPSGVFSHM
jgi:hypothetical protein